MLPRKLRRSSSWYPEGLSKRGTLVLVQEEEFVGVEQSPTDRLKAVSTGRVDGGLQFPFVRGAAEREKETATYLPGGISPGFFTQAIGEALALFQHEAAVK